MSGVLLSAALIVKNEERFLEQCLLSIKEIVDETVVVDTGSTDRTKQIAKECGARLHDFKWTDDFAAARNCALDRSRGEWILYIDADERARPCPASHLRSQLSNSAYVGYYVLLHPRPGFTPYRELRLFRNDPRIRFQGIIHESIWPGIHDYRAAQRGQIGQSDLVLDHEGYEGDQHVKHLRNLPLLRRALMEDPGRVFSWCHLANVYLALGKRRLAKTTLRRALAQVRKHRRHLPDDSLPYIGLIRWELSRRRDVEPLLAEALERFPRNFELRWLQGKALMSAGRFGEAVPIFERIVAAGKTGDFDYSMAHDTRLFTLFSYDAIAACHFKLGDYAESRRYFELAAGCDLGRLEYRVKAALCSRLESSRSGRSERTRSLSQG